MPTQTMSTASRELTEDGARRGGLPNGRCSKGWGNRCARSTGRSCRCACGGANHGKSRGGSGIVPGISAKAPAQNERDARFRVEAFEPERIVIRDLGPWEKHLTVTNDAENVIRRLSPAPQQRVFYYDSEGQLDELVHDGHRRFIRFAPGPRATDSFHNTDGGRARPDLADALDRVCVTEPRMNRSRGGGNDVRALLAKARTSTSYSPLPAEQSYNADWIRHLIVAGQYTRERACDTKARFGQYVHAEKAKGDIEARPTFDGIALIIYPCPFCAGFHFASAKAVLAEVES